jgi:hypothetical protein
VPPDLRVGAVVRTERLAGARWGVVARAGQTTAEQDVVLAETASLDVRVDAPVPRGSRAGVLVFSPHRPWGLGFVTALPGADDIARFGDLDPGEWRIALMQLDAFDRIQWVGRWRDVLLEPGLHHEIELSSAR